ncbi:TadE/TadG family type IV pilus assembly protein [Salipiger mucosus]|uniref:Flp pilus assembly protein TadG n=1 Tax=Salipiger mucosus DSM 16094 TaxID=1123237 RepID=S9SH19_9RHOB|nr:TadE/TadG family type IV pilus assembly protein [Salipiger mucosus]EPX85569.1 Flp pilus assembly protein TadG [Salipiger mucosus DSM 16094]
MIRFIKTALCRFRDREDGSMVVPFALWTPLFIGLVLSTIELGTVTLRQTVLERALDQSVRGIKLATGSTYDHALLKSKICARAGTLPDCENTLQLEMLRLDPRDWTEPPHDANCVDTAQPVTPQRAFEFGQEHDLMLLRACYKYRPISPAGYLSSDLATDAEGYTALVSTAVYVSEPL